MQAVIDFVLNHMYLRLIAIAVATVAASFLVKYFLRGVLRPLTRKTKTKIDDLIVRNLSSMAFYIVFVIGLKIGFNNVEFASPLFHSIIETLLIITIAILIIRLINNIADNWRNEWAIQTASSADDRLIPLIEKILKVVVGILAVIFIFDSWSIDISPLLATAGIAGIAIGFAVRDSLANIMGGLQLVLDKTFKVGDKVKLESGELGVILDIGLRSTKLKTYDNEVIYIPNGFLANAKVKNYTVPDLKLRVNVEFGVVYGSDTDKVREVVLEAVRSVDKVLDDPEPAVQFLKMSDFSLDFVARAWVNTYLDAYSTHLVLTDEIYKALNRAGISIPFPTRTVYTKSLDKPEKNNN